MRTRLRTRSIALAMASAMLASTLALAAPAVAAESLGATQAASAAAELSIRVLPAKRVASSTPTISGRAIATVKLTAKPGRWTSGASLSYKWFADGKAISGATKSTLTLKSAQIGKRITVKVTGKKAGHTTVSKTSKPTAAVKSGKARPASKTSCPKAYPIKGNQTTRHTSDWIYHVPGGRYYAATHPEECFATETAARAAGYRASKV
ncbi:hypothetical protein LJR045_000525 [Microbacterium sp. LjRoot45]|uniref:sunset domain-containing protein n=1 Tax=Microbacterium sp. LjRoot45 TaxID=3342329 RepID=UPI003ED09EDB